MPEFGRLFELHEKPHVLFDMTDFHGWTAGALRDDTKSAMHHFSDIDRVTVVGDKKQQQGKAKFCKPFTKATVEYIDHADATETREWSGEA